MQNNILNTDTRTFSISFLYRSTNKLFIFQTALELKYILENYDKNGIDQIKEFDPCKGEFKKISKQNILNFVSWETEAAEYLKNHYYFKK